MSVPISRPDVGPLLGSIEQSPIATVVTNPRLADNPIVAANAAFARLTGFAPDEVIGRNCRFLAGPDTNPRAQASLREAVSQQKAALTELVNYRKDGTRFRNAVMVAPVLDEAGKALFFVGSQMELVGEAVPRRAETRQLV